MKYIQIKFKNLNKEISIAVSLALTSINFCTRKLSDSPGSLCLFITFHVKTSKDHRRLVSHNYNSSVCHAS